MGHTGWLMPCAVELRGMGEIMREHSRPCESRTYRGAMPDVPMLEPCGYGAVLLHPCRSARHTGD